MAAKAKDVDWERVEADYRAGILTDRAIGKSNGLSHGAIQKRAKKEGWSRDLAQRIEKRREEKVAKAAVAKHGSQMSLATEKQVIEANAEMQTSVILGIRKDVGLLKKTVLGLASELSALSNQELQDALELILVDKTDKSSQAYITALNKAFDAALSLGGRSSTVKNLVGSLGILIDKERQAFGIDRDSGHHQSVGEFLESAVARVGRGHLRARDPAAVGVAEEVLAGRHGGVHVGGGEGVEIAAGQRGVRNERGDEKRRYGYQTGGLHAGSSFEGWV